ncbi:MAG: SpoIIE family protein phosphatase [Bacteroidales bacterium]|nr:SpoIIE family protein phosphatase [Bacteroidales bacterium]
MKLRPYSIRNNIIVANTFLIALYAILITTIVYNNNRYNAFLHLKNQILNLSALSRNNTALINTFLVNETINPKFYRFGISQYVREIEKNKQKLFRLKQSFKANEYQSIVEELNTNGFFKSISLQLSVFDSLKVLQLERGFQDFGTVGKMRNVIHRIEHRNLLTSKDLLTLRRHEKDYLIRKQKKYVDLLNHEVEHQIEAHCENNTVQMLSNYQYYFNQVIALDSIIYIDDNSLYNKLLSIDLGLIRQIEKANRIIDAHEYRFDKIKQIRLISFSVTFILISFGLNLFLAIRLSKNLHALHLSLKQFVASGYRESSPLKLKLKNDEVTDLIYNFHLLKSEIVLLINNFDDQLEKRTQKIEKQSAKLQERNQTIQESLAYASKIQQALLPDLKHIHKIFPESFLIYEPRDAVSGDFVWVKEIKTRTKDYSFAILGDCTGHGVPGAMISMIAITSLNHIILNKKRYKPDQILEYLNNKFNDLLKEEGNQQKMYDGVDIAVVRFDNITKELQYAGANINLFQISESVLITHKSDRTAVGRVTESNYRFANHTISTSAGDLFYLASDGFKDQFGGENNKKLKSIGLFNLLLEVSKYDVSSQSEVLLQEFNQWKGQNEQIDDVTVFGFGL